jgi:hypothetical protein
MVPNGVTKVVRVPPLADELPLRDGISANVQAVQMAMRQQEQRYQRDDRQQVEARNT